MEEVMLTVGSVVRGNWSTIEYRVDHAWEANGKGYWCVNGKAVDNPMQSGSFSFLGERIGDEILLTDPKRPDDRLLVIKDKGAKKKRAAMQMQFAF